MQSYESFAKLRIFLIAATIATVMAAAVAVFVAFAMVAAFVVTVVAFAVVTAFVVAVMPFAMVAAAAVAVSVAAMMLLGREEFTVKPLFELLLRGLAHLFQPPQNAGSFRPWDG